MMNPLNLIKDIFRPAADLIDNVHTSEEEKGEIRIKLDQIESVLTSEFIALQMKLLEAQSSIIKAEAEGSSWIQRSWRPVTMLVFLALVVFDSFGWLPNRLAPEALDIIKIGLGGYVIGRSVEKTAKAFKGA
jgi:hypothetical protein